MDFNLLSEADKAGFDLEQARRALENAKASLEQSKKVYEDVIGKAEEAGIPRAKFKKVIEDRVFSLFEHGFAEANVTLAPRPERPKRAKKAENVEAIEALITEPMAETNEIQNGELITL